MKQILIILFACFIVSCSSKSQLSKDLDCNPTDYTNLETVEDIHKQFSIRLPENWKTNLYYDNVQSSIFSADTTQQLTETYLIDITYVKNELKMKSDFFVKFKNNLTNQQLVETTSYELKFQDKESYYSRALGKKGNFNYQICNLFIKVNTESYLHAKVEVYGDSLVNERICNAFNLIEKIKY